MKRRTLIGGVVCGMVGLNLPGGAAGLIAAQAGAQGAVGDAERGFAATMAKRDITAFATFISDEALFLGSEGNYQPVRGRRAIVDAWKKYFDGPTAPFAWEPDMVEVLESGTLGVTSGPVRNASGTLISRFHSVWRLEADGRWRVVFDRGSSLCSSRQ